MRTAKVILQELALARKRKDYEECVALCREGVRLTSSAKAEGWYVFRYNLAHYLESRSETARGNRSAEDIEEAIMIYSQLLPTLSLPNDAARRGAVFLGLGWAYYLRTRGSPQKNLKKALKAFAEALAYYTRETDPYTWASISAMRGKIYSMMDRGTNVSMLLLSIERYEEALEIFTEAAYPDDWDEISEQLANLEIRLRSQET
jgi:tetratricopeptide (TPR) repeat protein